MKNALVDTLETIGEKAEGDNITVDEINQALKYRGFGTILIAPALLMVLPTGAIPGMPAICGALIFAITIQVAFGKKSPWIPKAIKERSFSREKYDDAFKKARPYLLKIDNFFHPRLKWLTHEYVQPVMALLCAALGLAIIAMGFVPFAAMIPSVAVLLLALGLSVKDGLFVMLGLIACAGTIYGAYAIFF